MTFDSQRISDSLIISFGEKKTQKALSYLCKSITKEHKSQQMYIKSLVKYLILEVILQQMSGDEFDCVAFRFNRAFWQNMFELKTNKNQKKRNTNLKHANALPTMYQMKSK